MSEIFLPFQPRRDDTNGHMVVQQNLDALLREFNRINILLSAATVSGQVLTYTVPPGGDPVYTWSLPDIKFVEVQVQTNDLVNTFDFQIMPTGYRHLLLVGDLLGTNAVAQVAGLRFNNDSGNNYDYQHILGQGAAAGAATAAAQSFGYGAFVGGTGFDAPSTCTIYIPNYAQTIFRKQANAFSAVAPQTGTPTHLSSASGWRNTAAVTRVQLVLSAGNFKSGSSMSLYGLK